MIKKRTILLCNERWITFKNFKQNYNVWLKNVLGKLIYYERLVPTALCLPFNSHIKKAGRYRHYEISILLLEITAFVHQTYAFPIITAR
jgi:hypothetical protein